MAAINLIQQNGQFKKTDENLVDGTNKEQESNAV